MKEKTKLHQKLSQADEEFGTEDDIANYPITTPCQPEDKSHQKSVRSYLRPHMVSFHFLNNLLLIYLRSTCVIWMHFTVHPLVIKDVKHIAVSAR